MNADKTWLIRTFDHKIKGPYPLKKIHEFITKGELRARDEVCQSNGFWFRLNEDPQTLREQLQIDPLQEHFLFQEEEITEISQQTATLKMEENALNEGSPSTFDSFPQNNEIENFKSYPVEVENQRQRAIRNKKRMVFILLALLVSGILFYFYYSWHLNL